MPRSLWGRRPAAKDLSSATILLILLMTASYITASMPIDLITPAFGKDAVNKFDCPKFILDKNKHHVFFQADLFQGKPEKLGELIPDPDGNWAGYVEVPDPEENRLYFVCNYRGTDKTITIREPDKVSFCSAKGYCR